MAVRYDPRKERVIEIAQKAASMHLGQSTDLSVAIAKLASEIPDENFLKRVTEQANLMVQNTVLSSGDKRREWKTASVEAVMSAIEMKKEGSQKVASNWLRDLPSDRTMVKQAHEARMDPTYNVPVTEFGIPMVEPPGFDPKDSEQLMKAAASVSYDRLKMAAEMSADEDREKFAHIALTYAHVKDFIRRQYWDGGDLFKTAASIVFSMPQSLREKAAEFVDTAVTDLVGKEAFRIGDYDKYIEKSASVDLSQPGLMTFRGGDSLIIELSTCLGYMDNGERDEHSRMARPGEGGGFTIVDDNMPYKVTRVGKPVESNWATVRGKYV